MLGFLRLILSPILSFFSLILGNGFLMTLLPIRAGLEGFSPEISGYLASAYFAGILIGAIKIHKVIEGIGHIRAFAFFASIISILTLFQGLYISPIPWILMRFFFGLGMGGVFVTIESWLLVKSGAENRGMALSLYMTVFYVGTSAGQLFLGFFETQSLYPFCFVVILTSFSVLLLTVTKTKMPIVEESSYLSPVKLFKIAPLAVLAALFSGLILGPIYGLLPVFAQSFKYTNSQISWIMLSTIFGGLLCQWPIGIVSDLIDRRKVILVASMLATGLSLVACFFPALAFGKFILFAAIFGGFCFVLYPLSISYACDVVEAKDIIATTGAVLVSYGCGSILGPTIASYAMTLFGPVGLFYFLASMGFGLSLCIFLRIFLSPQTPKREKLPYTNLTQTTPIAFELDPRAETNDETDERG